MIPERDSRRGGRPGPAAAAEPQLSPELGLRRGAAGAGGGVAEVREVGWSWGVGAGGWDISDEILREVMTCSFLLKGYSGIAPRWLWGFGGRGNRAAWSLASRRVWSFKAVSK